MFCPQTVMSSISTGILVEFPSKVCSLFLVTAILTKFFLTQQILLPVHEAGARIREPQIRGFCSAVISAKLIPLNGLRGRYGRTGTRHSTCGQTALSVTRKVSQ